MAARPCITCGVPTSGTYCAAHDPRRFYRDPVYRRQQRAAQAHRGQLCPECKRPMTVVSIDHKKELTRGGTNDPRNERFTCVPCNKAKKRGALNGDVQRQGA